MRRLKATNLVGDNAPKFQWEATAPGQTNYIALRCAESGIRVLTNGQSVLLYSKKKIPDLLAIIEESIQYLHLEEPALCKENMVCKQDRTILGVLVKKSDTCFVTEKHFSELVFHTFKREIPRVSKYVIFNSHRELMDYLCDVEGIIV